MNITVVVPVHNAEDYLEEALDSIFSQSYKADQVLLIDDASTDNSVAVAKKYAGKVEIHQVDFRNAAKTRNEAMKYARGDLLAFLDSDDIWYRNHLSGKLKYFKNNKCVGVINPFDYLSLDGKKHKNENFNFEMADQDRTDVDFINWYAKRRHFVGLTSCVVRKDRFIEIGGFDEDFKRRHDIEMWLRLIHNHSWSLDKNITSAYRKGVPGSISSSKVESQIYKFKAFKKNSETFDQKTPAYRWLLSDTAKAAISTAILSKDKELIERSWVIANQYLTPVNKTLLKIGEKFPSLFKMFYSFGKYLLVRR